MWWFVLFKPNWFSTRSFLSRLSKMRAASRGLFPQNLGWTQIRLKFQAWTTTSIQTKRRLGVLWNLKAFPTLSFSAISIRAICFLRLSARPQSASKGQSHDFLGTEIQKVFLSRKLMPPGNVYSLNELVELWESKIGKKLRKVFVSEEELLKKIKGTPYPDNMALVFIYSAFIKGDQTYFDIESSGGADGTKLYPELKYTTISQYLDTLL
ncbi:hypothetical protein M0R45_008173 [Rubus argutus]|uniref:NmrA-like domain-containing protein n=1 Tax=Rubus argutus TaxID=59490 RepID=A0AAW1XZZ9_RUBAR